MNKQYFSPEQDGFYGVYYPNPSLSHMDVIVCLQYHRVVNFYTEMEAV